MINSLCRADIRSQFVLLLLFLAPSWAFAQDGRTDVLSQTQNAADTDCPRRAKLAVICAELNSRSEAQIPVPGNNRYNYYKSIYEASCALDTDPPEVVKHKIRVMWDSYKGTLNCTDSFFEVPRGNIIKYGVAMNFDRFIRDVTRWGVDLNMVDESDGRTALDYVRDMMAKHRGNTHEAKLQMYYNQLRKAGARHVDEL